MQNNQPILSCAGRDSVNVDTILLQQLLENFKPTLIGIKERARQLEREFSGMQCISGEFALERFKDIITNEFLFIQLMEASRLARQEPVGSTEEVPDDCM
jgi:hypothetical protein